MRVLAQKSWSKCGSINIKNLKNYLFYFRIGKLTNKFGQESNKLQKKLTNPNFRDHGNPANQLPHVPMTNKMRIFHRNKEMKETKLRQDKNLLQQTYHHERALLTSQRLTLENAHIDIESEFKTINIKLHK